MDTSPTSVPPYDFTKSIENFFKLESTKKEFSLFATRGSLEQGF
jgi:hypothetical protein